MKQRIQGVLVDGTGSTPRPAVALSIPDDEYLTLEVEPNSGPQIYFSTSTDPAAPGAMTASGDGGLVGTIVLEYDTADKTLVEWGDSICEGDANITPSHGTSPGLPQTAGQIYAAAHGYSVNNVCIGGIAGYQAALDAGFFIFDLVDGRQPSAIQISYGNNDIGGTQTDVQMIQTISTLIRKAWTYGPTEVWLSTLPPSSSYTAPQQAYRNNVNAWIRSMPMGVDRVIDRDLAVRDPGTLTRILPAYDSGDTVHLNATGQAVLAATYPSTLPCRRKLRRIDGTGKRTRRVAARTRAKRRRAA